NKLRSAYYDMRRVINLVGAVIPPQYFRLGIVVRCATKGADILARRCNRHRFARPGGDRGALGWRAGRAGTHRRSAVAQGTIASLIHSTAFVINTQGGPNEPAGLIHFRDARSATGEWNSRTRRLDNLLSVTGRDADDRPTALTLYLDGRTITAEKDSSGW